MLLIEIFDAQQKVSVSLVKVCGIITSLSAGDEEAGADIVRSRTTSDLTHVTTSTTANKYQYLMKVNK